MFGGVLSKLLAKGAQGGAVARVGSKYGDDITRNLASQYGDDEAANILSSLTGGSAPAPLAAPRTMLSQIQNGVEAPRAVNPSIKDNYAVEGATDMVLGSNKGVGNKVKNFGKSVEEAGTKLKNNQIMGSIRDKKVLERSPDAIKWAEKYGFNTNQYEDVSNILTGNEGILSNFNNNALKNAKRSVLMPDSARDDALKAVDRAISLEPHSKKTLKRIINDSYDLPTSKIGERLAERGEVRPTAIGEADIYDMHKAVQEIESIAYKQTGKDADEVQGVLRPYADKLKQSINEAAKEIYRDRDNVQELTAALQGANLSPQLNKDILDSIRTGTDYLGIRSMQSPAVTLGKVAEAEKLAPLAGGIAAGGNQMFSNPLLQVANEVVGKPVASMTGKALQKGGRAVQVAAGGGSGGGGGINPLVAGGVGLGGLGILNNMMGGGQLDQTAGGIAPVAGGSEEERALALAAGGPEAAGGANTIGGYGRQELEDAYVAALMDNNAEAADAIGNMIGMLDDKDKATADAAKASGGGKTGAALNALGSLTQVYNQGGGAQGAGGALTGLLNKATFGMINPTQAAYEDQTQATAVAIARAYGETGALSNQDIENYRKMLPTFSDNPQQAQIKLDRIYADLQYAEE